jgi:hypothetical protein
MPFPSRAPRTPQYGAPHTHGCALLHKLYLPPDIESNSFVAQMRLDDGTTVKGRLTVFDSRTDRVFCIFIFDYEDPRYLSKLV